MSLTSENELLELIIRFRSAKDCPSLLAVQKALEKHDVHLTLYTRRFRARSAVVILHLNRDLGFRPLEEPKRCRDAEKALHDQVEGLCVLLYKEVRHFRSRRRPTLEERAHRRSEARAAAEAAHQREIEDQRNEEARPVSGRAA